jgi:hypothetical protein
MARIVGGQNLARHLKMNARGKDVTDVLVRAADRVRTEYIDRVNEGGSPGPLHVPSQPGEAPNTDSGRLVGSATASRVSRNKAETSVEADYGAWLEFGTDKMAPRPALGPSFDHLRPHIVRNIERALKDG